MKKCPSTRGMSAHDGPGGLKCCEFQAPVLQTNIPQVRFDIMVRLRGTQLLANPQIIISVLICNMA